MPNFSELRMIAARPAGRSTSRVKFIRMPQVRPHPIIDAREAYHTYAPLVVGTLTGGGDVDIAWI